MGTSVKSPKSTDRFSLTKAMMGVSSCSTSPTRMLEASLPPLSLYLSFTHLVGMGTSVKSPKSTDRFSLTKAMIGVSSCSTSPTRMLEASEPGGSFLKKCSLNCEKGTRKSWLSIYLLSNDINSGTVHACQEIYISFSRATRSILTIIHMYIMVLIIDNLK